MALDQELVEILRCPKCKGELETDKEQTAFTCRACMLRYPVVDDIPNFIVEEAESLAKG